MNMLFELEGREPRAAMSFEEKDSIYCCYTQYSTIVMEYANKYLLY